MVIMAQPTCDRALVWRRISEISLTGLVLAIFLLIIQPVARADSNPPQASASSCTRTYLDFDAATNLHAIEEYERAIGGMLRQERFAELDCIADSARASKARFAGSAWKLHRLYAGLSAEQFGHPTEEDWREHLQRLERWVKARPDSITARVALAKSYERYAWAARGTGFSDTVSESGWKLFGQRLEKAKSILDQASSLHPKCPEWYAVMQEVARGQGWDLAREKALLDEAVAFEPDFYYFQRNYAFILLPKWEGKDGDAQRFAAQAADHRGGAAGDILYYQIAAQFVCNCREDELDHFSWPRLQQGFAAIDREYGQSLHDLNWFAYLALNRGDYVAADPALQRLGENWLQDAWDNEAWFHQRKAETAQQAPLQLRSRGYEQEAKANMQTAEGIAYKKKFDLQFAAHLQDCARKSGKFLDKTDFFVLIRKDGGADNAFFAQPTHVGICLMQDLGAAHARNDKIFPVPPRDSYWVFLEIDPSAFNTAAAVQ
jgi:hypothetical protein